MNLYFEVGDMLWTDLYLSEEREEFLKKKKRLPRKYSMKDTDLKGVVPDHRPQPTASWIR